MDATLTQQAARNLLEVALESNNEKFQREALMTVGGNANLNSLFDRDAVVLLSKFLKQQSLAVRVTAALILADIGMLRKSETAVVLNILKKAVVEEKDRDVSALLINRIRDLIDTYNLFTPTELRAEIMAITNLTPPKPTKIKAFFSYIRKNL